VKQSLDFLPAIAVHPCPSNTEERKKWSFS
jgi:hypothetical protein